MRGYKTLITKKRGVRQDDAPSNAASTIAAKGKDHWMINTGETKRRGFKSISRPNSLTVFAPGQRHSGKRVYMGVPGGHKGQKAGVRRPRTERRIVKYNTKRPPPTYRQLFRWHNQEGYSGVYGQLPVNSRFNTRFSKEVIKQFKTKAPGILSRRIKVKIG